ncbi:MAG: PorP/SprF family type IX secretion system membrane protein, partial [Microscillaceae bacterium]|nr:PorP/SprF family type IX secretion system membrane protein [Microscillaceae bacterium]
MNFKKYILALIMASLAWGGALAQQRFQFSQYMLNNFLLNPAVAGAYDYIDVRAGFRNQWTGFEDAPRSFFLSGHFSPRIFKRDKAELVLPTIGTIDYHLGKGTKASALSGGFGGLFVYDQTGPISRIMFSLSYALHFPISDKLKASLGLQGGFIQYRLNNDELVPDPINGGLDPAVGTGVSTS